MAFNIRSGQASIADGSITAAKLADNSVIESKIATDAVSAAKIAANAVIEAKIAANAVSNGKIANNAVDANKIATNAVTETKIANDAVSHNKLSVAASLDHILGTEQVFTHLGDVLTTVAEFNFQSDRDDDTDFYKQFSFTTLIEKTGGGGATLEVWIDGEQAGVVNSGAASAQATSEGIIPNPTQRNHFIELKLQHSISTETVTLKRFELYASRKS